MTTVAYEKKGKIKKSILFLLGMALLLMLGITIFSTYQLQQSQIDDEVQARLAGTQKLFGQLLSSQSDSLSTQIYFLKGDQVLQQHWLAQDRVALRQYAEPIFHEIRTKFDVTHFYFTGLDRVCFLRVHNFDQHGDQIDRFTMTEAVDKRGDTSGIELGPWGTFTLRVVSPWRINGKLVGYIELGKEIDQLTPLLAETFGVELISVIAKEHLDRLKWEKGMEILGRSHDWSALPHEVVVSSTLEGALPPQLHGSLSLSHEEHRGLSFRISHNGTEFRGGILPLIDAGGQEVGGLVVLHNVNAAIADMKSFTFTLFMVFILIGGLLFFIFYMFTTGLENRMMQSFRSLEEEIEERRKAEKTLQDYKNRLEELVAQRTIDLKATNAALLQEVAERERTEKALKLDEERLEALLQLGQHDWETEEELTDFALEEGVRLTKSKVGYLHFFSEDQKTLSLFAWSKETLKYCSAANPLHYPLESAGIWADCVRQRQPVIHNDYPSRPDKKGLPEGHVPLLRHLSVPIFDGERIVAVAGVGNKDAPYNQSDIRQLTLYIASMFRLLQARRAEVTLKNSHAELKQIFDSAADGMWIAGEDYSVIKVNQTLLTMTGFSEEEVLGQKCYKLLPSKHCHQPSCPKHRIFKGAGRLEFETVQTRKDGSELPCIMTVTPFLNSNGELIGFIEDFKDITERKQVELDLQIAMKEAEAANQAKSEFLASMSHEIRTPMNAIIGMGDLLSHTDLSPQQQEYVQIFQDSGENLLQLINDILDISKIEAGNMELEQIGFNLNDLLDKTCKVMSIRAYAKDLELVHHIDNDVFPYVIGDPNRLRQILINLIGNAIKFTEQGEIIVRVECRDVTDDMATLAFSVSDTGIGIPDEKKALIFDSFSQADSSTTRKFGGTGLGLSISRQLVEMMDGRIWAKSHKEQGSTFFFTVRLTKQSRPEKRRNKRLSDLDLQEMTILLIDDTPASRLVLKKILSGWGAEVHEAVDGKSGLAAIKQAAASGKPFQLIFLNCRMPDMDGFEVAEHLHKDRSLAGLTVMMVSSDNRKEHAAKAKKLGIAAYLTKPLKREILFDTMKKLLQKKGAHIDKPRISKEKKQQADIRDAATIGPLHILLAEDDKINQKVASQVLENMGHKVTIANNGKEAVELFAAEPFDLVLMDINMPLMDGYEATGIIREQEQETDRHTPIVALSALAFEEDRKKCLAHGMEEYISKPFRYQQLNDTIQTLFLTSAAGRIPGQPTRTELAAKREQGPSVFRLKDALTGVDNDMDQLRQLAAMFVSDVPQYLHDIRQTIENSDHEALRRGAHKLKGAVTNFSAPDAYDISFKLEKMGKENESWTAIEQKYALLVDRVTALQEALTTFLQEDKV
jgi:PAS domain S-box-containing protein